MHRETEPGRREVGVQRYHPPKSPGCIRHFRGIAGLGERGRTQELFISGKVVREPEPAALRRSHRTAENARHLAADRVGDVILDREQAGQVSFVGMRPEMSTR